MDCMMETLYFLLHRNGPPPSIHESSLRNGFCSSSPRVLCRRGVSGELRDPVPQVFSQQKQGPKNRLLNGSVEALRKKWFHSTSYCKFIYKHQVFLGFTYGERLQVQSFWFHLEDAGALVVPLPPRRIASSVPWSGRAQWEHAGEPSQPSWDIDWNCSRFLKHHQLSQKDLKECHTDDPHTHTHTWSHTCFI